MCQLFDHKYSDRVSDSLKEKVLSNIKADGVIARGVLEAIRLLEGDTVAQSTKAMLHKEREFKGELAGFYHIHVAENVLSRTINNVGKKKRNPVKNPEPDEVIEYVTIQVLESYAKSCNIPYSQDNSQHLVESIRHSSHVKKVGLDKVLASLQEKTNVMINNVFYSKNKVTGDWLIYKKHSDGKNYYLDYTPHISPHDLQLQSELKASLSKSFELLISQC
ncbi:hypothetical protein CLM71_10040 [Serratia sp. MYb239]|uniref:hypothetical protein n=1 Tax=Serratia sp. MYb239 TaxID=2033438 RepID=UPI000CF6D01E|nr:hypothetical protein [Serratia sp. MYb239]AVJ17456.1 hypothetical protein CLM71_10040 [Serratia sp. MYb239]